MTAPQNPRVTQAVTPERAAVHAAINALTSPPCAFVPLRETCEAIAAHERHLVDRIAELEAAEAASKAREAALVKAATELRDDLLMRADIDREGIAIVAAGHGVWCRFNDALDAALTKEPDA